MSSLAPPHSIETAVSLGASDKSPFPAEEKVNSIDGLPDHTIMDDVAQGYSGLKDLKSGGITTPLGSPKTATPTAGSPLTPTDSTLTPTGTTQPPLTRSKSDLGSGISHRNFLNDFPKGMGLGPDAEIWTKYNDFTTQYDKEMLDTYNGGMDNLLIFAALFSAIVTAFLMESLDLLSPDTSGATLDALTTVSAQLSALGTSSSIMPASYQETQFTIPTSALYVNALWIFSLSISLSASVLAMLVKQWLRVYDTDWPSVPHDRANFRQFRYHGLVKWQVPGIANSLPLLLQISVALFLAGFVVYLWGTSPGLQWLLLILFISGGIGYVGLGVAAVIWIDCPFKSPLSQAFDLIWCYSVRWIALLFSTDIADKTKRYYPIFGYRLPFLADLLFDLKAKDRLNLHMPMSFWIPLTPKRVLRWINDNQDPLDESAISWLSEESSDLSTAKHVVTACFSSHKYQDFMEKNRDAISSAAKRCLRPAGGEAEPKKWEAIKQKLIEAAIARTFADWGEVGDPYYAWYNRLWTIPSEQVPVSDHFLYYALLVTCAGPYPGCGPELRRAVRRWVKLASEKLIENLRQESTDVSSLGCWLFSSYLAHALAEDKDDFWADIMERLRHPMLSALAMSASLPLEVLYCMVELAKVAERRDSMVPFVPSKPSQFWIPTLPTDTKDRLFYEPIITAPHHGDLERAALQYATNELKSRSPNSIRPEDGIRLILAWFETNGFFYPHGRSHFQTSDDIRERAKVELEFLQACREAQAEKNQCDIWNSNLVKICQVLDIETDFWNLRELSGGRVEYHEGFDRDLEGFLRHAISINDTRGLIIGLVLLSHGLFISRYLRGPLAILLAALQKCDLAEVVLATPSRSEHLCKILLHWLHRKESFGPDVVAVVKRLTDFRDHHHLSGNRHFHELMKQYERTHHAPPDTCNPSHAHAVWRASYIIARMLRRRTVDPHNASVESFEVESDEPTDLAEPVPNLDLERQVAIHANNNTSEPNPQDGGGLQVLLERTSNLLQMPAWRNTSATPNQHPEVNVLPNSNADTPAPRGGPSSMSLRRLDSDDRGSDILSSLRAGWSSLMMRIPTGSGDAVEGGDGLGPRRSSPGIEVIAPDGHLVETV